MLQNIAILLSRTQLYASEKTKEAKFGVQAQKEFWKTSINTEKFRHMRHTLYS